MKRVLVVGGGIGGLVVAQGLRAAGVAVCVHERDTDLARTGGYRLHLDPTAVDVLRRRLSAPLFQAVVASAAPSRSFRRFAVLDHRLRVLARIPHRGDGDHLLIGRVPLRLLLGHGLDGAIRLGSEFSALGHEPDGTVTATFADGRTETADVLVGADGSRSRVVAALTGDPTARPLSASGLAGRAALGAAVRAGLPADLRSGPAFVLGPDGTAVFLSLHDPSAATIAADACRDVAAILEPPYVLWGIIEPGTATGPAPAVGGDLDSALDRARHLLTGWSGWMHTLLDHSDPARVTRFPYYAADPDTDLTPWQARAVTALGDAVHAMPPTGGQGAATAIRDADLLTTHLLAARDRGGRAVALALHDYQQAMARYAVPALRESLQPLRWQRHLTSPLGHPLLRALLPVVGALAGARAALRPEPTRT
jgi:2-polyprenyl-6-methoxyphenol hydroxylase-like FAD-dependent oxidoreductase